MTKKTSHNATPTLRDVWSLLWNRMGSNRLMYIVALLFGLGETFAMMVFPLFENLYFNYLEEGRFGFIQLLLIICTVAFSFFMAMFALGEYLKKTTMTKLNLDMTVELADEAQQLPLETAQGSHSSDLVQRVTHDTKRTTGLLTIILGEMGNQIVMFLLALIYIMWLNWKIGLVLLIVSPLLLLSSHLLRHQLKQTGHEIAEQEAVVRQCQQDTIQNMEIIHAYGIGKWMEDRFVQERTQLNKLYMKRMWWRLAVSVTSSTLISVIVIGTVVAVGWLAIQGTMTLGSLMAFFTLVWRINSPLSNIGRLWGRIQEGLGSAGRTFTLLRAEKEPVTTKKMKSESMISVDDVVSLNRVNFVYRRANPLREVHTAIDKVEKEGVDDGKLLLNEFSLRVPSGSFVAIVGPSGSGKSTVAKITAGLLFPKAGEVCIDGQNPLQNAEQARQMVAYVPQSPYLFSGTIRANLMMVNPDANEEKMKIATQMAHAHEFIQSFPDGYDTELLEQGQSLSGGQRQRLAIARALLADRPIWIFDEATSALDQETERKVMQNLQRVAEEDKRTMIVIAHRLSTVHNADHIVVMKGGRIVQQGKHDELVADHNGLYRQINIF